MNEVSCQQCVEKLFLQKSYDFQVSNYPKILQSRKLKKLFILLKVVRLFYIAVYPTKTPFTP